MTMSEKRETQPDEEQDDVRPLVKDNLYYAAKDGLSIVLYSLLAQVKSESARNVIINQVGVFQYYIGQKAILFIYSLRLVVNNNLQFYFVY